MPSIQKGMNTIMRKNKVFPILLLTVLFIFHTRYTFAKEEEENAENPLMFVCECDNVKDFSKMQNVSLYEIPEAERNVFYDDFSMLQRNADTEAYVIIPIPYMHSITIESYYRLNEDIDHLNFQISRDGEEWETFVPTSHEIVHTEPGKWSCVQDTLSEIESGIGMLKIIWPNNPTYWSPVVGKITAELEERRLEKIELQKQSVFAIPRFGIKTYTLSAQVLDQMNFPVEISVEWKQMDEIPGITLSADGILTVTDEGYGENNNKTIRVIVSCKDADLVSEWEFTLQDALLGDSNGDFVIDEIDLEYALQFYKATPAESECWEEIRLADINDDGIIDVYDIAYLAMRQESTKEDVNDDKDVNVEMRKDSEK